MQTDKVYVINNSMKITKTSLRHFFANVVCAFIYNDMTRKRVRAIIDLPYFAWRRFVHRDSGVSRRRIKTITGFSGRNLVFIAGNKYVYKFIHKWGAKNIEQREFDIATALADVSPIPLVVPTILNTSTGPVRRYDFAPGITLRVAAKKYPKKYEQNKDYLARQIANFIYEIARHRPAKIRKYERGHTPKNIKLREPEYMYGWYHGDIGDNFMIDPKTFRVLSVIDLESMTYGDFSAAWPWESDEMVSDFNKCIKRHYDEIWNAHQKSHAK